MLLFICNVEIIVFIFLKLLINKIILINFLERTKEKAPVLASKFHLNEIIRKKIMEPLIKEEEEFVDENIIYGQEYDAILVYFI